MCSLEYPVSANRGFSVCVCVCVDVLCEFPPAASISQININTDVWK